MICVLRISSLEIVSEFTKEGKNPNFEIHNNVKVQSKEVSSGSESGEQQLMVNSFLWNPFVSGCLVTIGNSIHIVTVGNSINIVTVGKSVNIFHPILFLYIFSFVGRCGELHNDNSVWLS